MISPSHWITGPRARIIMTVIAPIFPPKENPIIVTEKSKAIRITLNGTFGKCPEIIIGMASYGAVPISTSTYKATVRMNSITDGISTAIRTGNVVKKSAGSTRFQIHVKKSTKYPMRNIFASVPKPRFLPPKITTSTRRSVQ